MICKSAFIKCNIVLKLENLLPVIILGLSVHAALGQDVGQLGVVGQVGPAGVGELSVIFTEN